MSPQTRLLAGVTAVSIAGLLTIGPATSAEHRADGIRNGIAISQIASPQPAVSQWEFSDQRRYYRRTWRYAPRRAVYRASFRRPYAWSYYRPYQVYPRRYYRPVYRPFFAPPPPPFFAFAPFSPFFFPFFF